MNNLQTNKNTLLKKRVKEALEELEAKIRLGKINTESDLLKEIEMMYRDVFYFSENTTIEVPEYRKGELPIRDNLEKPLFSAENDISYSWEVEADLNDRLKNLFNLQRGEVLRLNELIGEVQNKLSRFQLFISDNEKNFLWSSDSFTSFDKININETTAYIDINSGVALLGIDSLNSLNSLIDGVSVDKVNSRGVPGNHLVATEITGSDKPDINKEPQVTLEGGSDTHSNFLYMFDSQPNTWLEWENSYIPRKQKLSKQGVARIYDPGGILEDVDTVTGAKGWGWKLFVSFPGELGYDKGPDGTGWSIANFDKKETSKLVFTVSLNTIQKVSAIKITPQIISGTYPTVNNILVSSDGTTWRTVASNVKLTKKLNENISNTNLPNNNYTGVGIWNIGGPAIKYIKVSLEAENFYSPQKGLAHKFYYKVTEEKSVRKYVLWTSVDKWIQETRLPNPETSVTTLPTEDGVQISGSKIGGLLGAIAASALKIGAAGGVPGIVIGAIAGSILGSIGSYEHSSNILREGSAFDIFQGERSVIGIKDIEISDRVYSNSSQIVSKEHTFLQPLSAASIIVTEDIPETWDHSVEWISYFISTDGNQWVKITPQNKTKGHNDTIQLNGEKSLFVKVILSRPDGVVNESPTLKNYAIKCVSK